MYYKSVVEGVARIMPHRFSEELNDAVLSQLKADYEGQIVPELGRVINILEIVDIGEGILIPGDGAAYYRTEFVVLHFMPELNELIEGKIKDIAKFGAFVDFGPFEGMIHISQTMDDFVSFNKAGALAGRESGKSLKVGDNVRARIVAISFKDPKGPKIGMTMRQPYLGKIEWIEELVKKSAKESKSEAKEEKKEKKPKEAKK